jgi:YHS domain-containing protein
MTLRIIVLAVLFVLVARAVRVVMRGVLEAAGPPRDTERGRPVKLARDPICGTHIPPAASLSLTSGGTTHYFCSEECRAKFRKSA